MRTTDRLDGEAGGLNPALFAQGAGQHPWVARLASDTGRSSGLDLADAIHGLTQLHGGAAGLVDGASLKARSVNERAFLIRAFDAWQCERNVLSVLSVAVGPVPSTPGPVGDGPTTASLASAIATLGSSERAGVTLGATAALVIEWNGLRPLLDRAAHRFGAPIPCCQLQDPTELLATVAGFIDTPAIERAAAFGARQLLRQHGEFIAMLERRARTRNQG